MKLHSRISRFAACAAVIAFTIFAEAAQPIRAVSMTVNKTNGAVTSFDLAFGTTPAATTLYVCWGATDGGSATNGWDHVEKLGDIAGDVTALNVPITRFPQWGTATCQSMRFVMEPGELFTRAGLYLATSDPWGAYIDTGYKLEKTDAMDVSWTFTHISAQPNAIVAGSVRYDVNTQNYADYFAVRYAGGGKVEAYISKRNGTADQKTSAGTSWTTTAAGGYIRENVRVHVALSATEQSIWTNSVNTATTVPQGEEVLLAHGTSEFDADFSQATNCFLFSWPGYDAGAGKAIWPNNSDGNAICARMYNFDITRSGAPTVSLLPVIKNGVACFYDTVRQVFLYNVGKNSFNLAGASISPDVGVFTETVSYEESVCPEGDDLEVTIPESDRVYVSGTVRRVGQGATSVDVYFACAPVGTELPTATRVQSALSAGDAIKSSEVTGLVPGTTYRYSIDLKNDQGVSMAMPITGTFVALAQDGWIGTGSNADWFDGANWNLGRAPKAGDAVTLPSGASVLLTNSTVALQALTVAGTLTATNWATKISATTVSVANGGVVTCVNGGTTEDSLSRVWIACDTLTIDAGGQITADKKGYAATSKSGLSTNQRVKGNGPGGEKDGGAAYGGYGSKCRVYNDYERGCPYGSAEVPEQAGSSGCTDWSHAGGAGGGAIRIEATGTVTVNGVLSAAGEEFVGGSYSGAGSGGGIYVTCATFAGSGVVSAAGGEGGDCTASTTVAAYGAPGGGGRIAIHYDAALQTGAMVAGMKITVKGGSWKKTAENDQDCNFTEAQMGTIWLTDEKMLSLLGAGLWGQLVNVALPEDPLTLDAIDLTWGKVRFADPGAQVTVTGDVTVNGVSQQLEIGADSTLFGNYSTLRPYTTKPVALTIGGDLVVTNGGRFDAWAAATNGTTDVAGALVTVGGLFRIANTSLVYSVSDSKNGGSPEFRVGSLDVQSGGKFSADKRGFQAEKGPGGGFHSAWSPEAYKSGGGHGGQGGLSDYQPTQSVTLGGVANDNPYLPILPGSGGGTEYWNAGGLGGGVIRVLASGHLQVDGTVTAAGQYTGGAGSGAGGTIFLRGATFAGGSTGVLTAKGADGKDSSDKVGAGGGGRIAVWTGEEWEKPRINSSRITKANSAAEVPNISFDGTATAAGGASTASVSEISCAGGDGSVWFVNVGPIRGFMLIFR